MNIEEIKKDLQRMREQWRTVRAQRLARKSVLLSEGSDSRAVRKDREYKVLKKEQKRISTLIRHGERKLNRMMARGEKKE